MGNTQSILFPVEGSFTVHPILYVKPTLQRASKSAAVGWSKRLRLAVTNLADRPLVNYPYALNLGLTNALVSGGKALASGNDLRVHLNGQEVPRTLVDWNSASFATLCWVIIPVLAVGDAITFDVVYGNASAGAPPTLTLGEDLPAFDIQTAGANRSTNTQKRFSVAETAANAGKGAWPLSSGTVAPDGLYNAPGAWQPETSVLSNDDRIQQVATQYEDGGTNYWHAIFDAARGRTGSLIASQDNGADGVAYMDPAGIVSVQVDMNFSNPARNENDGTPVGKLVIASRAGPGSSWVPFYENDTTPAEATPTIPLATYTLPAVRPEICFAVWPHEGSIVDRSARADRYVEASWHSTCVVNLQAGTITQSTVQAETEVYDLATELRYGGGGGAVGVPPYHALLIGNPRSESGAGSRHLLVELNQEVKIDTRTRTFDLWNSGHTARVGSIPAELVRGVDGVTDQTGALVERNAEEWMPWRPQSDLITNPSADVDASSWERGAVTAGVTANAISRNAATYDTAPGAFSASITANTAAAGATVENIASDYIPLGGRTAVQVGMAVRSTTMNIQSTPAVWFYDQAGTLISRHLQADWSPVSNTWERRLFSVAAPITAYSYRVGQVMKTKAGSGTQGTNYWDTVAVDDTEIALIDVLIGAISLSAEWLPLYG